MGFWDSLGNIVSAPSGASSGGFGDLFGPGKLSQDEQQRQQLLHEQAGAAGGFADYGEGGFKSLGTQADNNAQMLRDQATGKLSYSREALRQGLNQNLAGQRSLAAGASPYSAPMAARNAAMNSARLGYGLSGQSALAGIAEQQAAQKALTDAILQQRQQELQAALGSRQNAMTGYGAGIPFTPNPTIAQQIIPAVSQGLAFGATKSDARLKTDVRDGDAAARAALDKLAPFTFKYKDEKWGKGEQLGVMAQDLERAGAKHAVIDEPDGKAVHPGKAATLALALSASLHKRIAKLEGEPNAETRDDDAAEPPLARALRGGKR